MKSRFEGLWGWDGGRLVSCLLPRCDFWLDTYYVVVKLESNVRWQLGDVPTAGPFCS